ncbi:MAG: ABC transporter permease [Planctomycetota bacterium]|nr:ABC transporter permease [Planctomycetota bacterium]
MSPSSRFNGTWVWERIRAFGISRWIIVAFVATVWLLAAMEDSLNLGTLVGDSLVRTAMHGLLVLALVLPVRAGNGLNFGIPLGIVCGLVGGVCVIELAAPHPFGIQSWGPHVELARGWTGFILANLVAIPLAGAAGLAFGWLLERVRGQEMVVGIYVGFGAVAGFCVVWLLAPVTSPELVWPLKGSEIRSTIVLNDYFRWILDSSGEITFGEWAPEDLGPNGEPNQFSRPPGLYIPTGLLLYWMAFCGAMVLFLRTRLGTALTAAGTNPTYARSCGINVPGMRVFSIMISTVLSAMGILVYSQSYGFLQLYSAPLWMAFMIVAALLIGGASLRRASVVHVIIGSFLFFSLLTMALPVINALVRGSKYEESLGNLPEIARLVIQNGVILLALTQVKRADR